MAPLRDCAGENIIAQLALDSHGLISVDKIDVQVEAGIGG